MHRIFILTKQREPFSLYAQLYWHHVNNHITPVLKELHWLPVNEWIQFKTLVFTFSHYMVRHRRFWQNWYLRMSTPGLSAHQVNCFWRYQNTNLKPVDKMCLVLLCQIVISLSIFEKHVKTFSFKQAFNC